MARANPNQMGPSAPVKTDKGPTIIFMDKGAELVKFEVNPTAVTIKVWANGNLEETF